MIICCTSIFQNGCYVNMKDEESWTALWHAYSNSDEEIMTLLLKSGADKVSTNDYLLYFYIPEWL